MQNHGTSIKIKQVLGGLAIVGIFLALFSPNVFEPTAIEEQGGNPSARPKTSAVPEWSYTTGGDVYAVAISADGRYIAAGSYDNKLYLFYWKTSTPLWSYTGPNHFNAVAISADGQYIVGGNENPTQNVFLFNKSSSTPMWSANTGSAVPTKSVAISADGQYIVAGGYGGKVCLYNRNSSTPIWEYNIGTVVRPISISADGQYIAVGANDYKVYLLNRSSSTPLWSYQAYSFINSVSLSSDGQYLAVGGYLATAPDRFLAVFQRDSSTPLWSYAPATGGICSTVISTDGQYVFAGGSGTPYMYFFQRSSSTPVWTYTGAADRSESVAISASGDYMAAGNLDDKNYYFNKGSSTPIWNYATGNDSDTASISADGQWVATGSLDDKIYLYFHDHCPPTIDTPPSMTPSNPTLYDDVNITARVFDGSQVSKAWLEHNQTGAFQNYTMTLESGDLKEGYWKATIPKSIQGQKITYRIWVNDTLNQKNVTPYYNYNIDTFSPLFQSWNRTWGGNVGDKGYGVAVDGFGNIVLVGQTSSFGGGNGDAFIAKYDAGGTQLWNRTWGGDDLNSDLGWDAMADSSGNAYLAGYTNSYGAGNGDALLVKYDAGGTQLWNRTWGGINGEYGLAGAIDLDGNMYLAGYSSEAFIVKLDTSGIELWNRTWGGTGGDQGWAVGADSSGNAYLAGRTNSFGVGNDDAFIAKYDASGTQLWNQTWGGGAEDWGIGITTDSNGDAYLVGRTYSFGAGNADAFIVKYNAGGTQLWNRTCGGSINEIGWDIAVDESDNAYLVGGTSSFGAGNVDTYIVKYAPDGTQLWSQICGGIGTEEGLDIFVKGTDNLYLAGYTNSSGAGGWDALLVNFVIVNDYGPVFFTPPMVYPTYITQNDPVNLSVRVIDGDNVSMVWIQHNQTGVFENATMILVAGNASDGTWNFTIPSAAMGLTINYTIWANDSFNFVNNTGHYTYFVLDEIAPVFLSTGLAEGQVFNAIAPQFSLIVQDDNPNATWYSLDGGLTNTTCGLTGTLATQWSAFGNGTVLVTFWANDTMGNISAPITVLLRKDVYAPVITGAGLTNGTLFGTDAPAFALTISEANLNCSWYSFDNGLTNTTCSLAGALAGWEILGNGTVTVIFWANDTAGNINSTSLWLRKDIIAPIFVGTGFVPWQVVGTSAPAFSLTISEGNLNAMWYSLDGGLTKTTCELTGMLDAQWANYGNGTVTVMFWANDTVGNQDTTSVTMRKDIIAPSFTGIGILPGQLFGVTAPTFSLVISEGNLNAEWYSLDGGLTNTTCGLMDTLAAQWGAFGNGTVLVTFWANDTMGNISAPFAVLLHKDVVAPNITGAGLTNGTVYGDNAPSFALTIIEANLNCTWYSFDNGLTNTTCALTGMLAGWQALGNGTVTTFFWANDTLGNIARFVTILSKDIFAPIIHISGPSAKAWHADPPAFTLTIDDPNLASIWYSLDGGATNHSVAGLNGIIDAKLWNEMSFGQVTIRFYARDIAGNEASVDVVVVKILPWWAYVCIILGIAIPTGIFLKAKLIPAGRKRLRESRELATMRKVEDISDYLTEEYQKGWRQSQGRGGVQKVPLDRIAHKTGTSDEFLQDTIPTLCAQGVVPAFVHEDGIIFDFTPGLYAFCQIAKKDGVIFTTFVENLQELEKSGRLLLAFYAKNHRNPKREESWKLGVPITLLDACSAFINVAVDEDKLDIFQHLTPDERRILDGLSQLLFQRHRPSGQSGQETALSLDVLVQLPTATIVLAKILLPFVNKLMKSDFGSVHLPPEQMG